MSGGGAGAKRKNVKATTVLNEGTSQEGHKCQVAGYINMDIQSRVEWSADWMCCLCGV